MSDLAFTCAMLELPISPEAIYRTGDPVFLRWLADLTNRVASERRAQSKRGKAGG